MEIMPMGFTPVRNVRIKSLGDGALVQLRMGKAAVKSKDDIIVEARKLRDFEEGEKSLMLFEEHGEGGKISETIVSKFPGAPWRAGQYYVSLVAIDESTFAIQKAATPIQTDVISEAIKWIHAEYEDIYAPEQLIALLSHVQNGTRINTEVKVLATQLAHKLVHELSSLAAKDEARATESGGD